MPETQTWSTDAQRRAHTQLTLDGRAYHRTPTTCEYDGLCHNPAVAVVGVFQSGEGHVEQLICETCLPVYRQHGTLVRSLKPTEKYELERRR